MFRIILSSINNFNREKAKSTNKIMFFCIFLISFILFGCKWLPGGYSEITIDENGVNYNNNVENNDEINAEEDNPPIPDDPEPSTGMNFTDSDYESDCPCDFSGNPVDDPYVDVYGITANINSIDVHIRQAYSNYVESVYSFAILIHILLDGNYYADFISETHAKNQLVGQQDPNTGQIVEGTEGQVILEPQGDGSLKVSVIDFDWPEGSEVEINVESFHMADSSSDVHMDTFFTGPFPPLNSD